MKALGQPPSSTPPPPVLPGPDIPSRRLAPVQPPPAIPFIYGDYLANTAEKPDVSQTEGPPIGQPGPLQQIVPPLFRLRAAQAFEVHEALPVELFIADSSSLLMNFASSYAAIGFSLDASTASDEPPQLPETSSPAVHCGSGAARHRPEVPSAVPCRNTGAHAAVSQPAYFPLARPWYHSSLKSTSVEMRSAWISSVQ